MNSLFLVLDIAFIIDVGHDPIIYFKIVLLVKYSMSIKIELSVSPTFAIFCVKLSDNRNVFKGKMENPILKF